MDRTRRPRMPRTDEEPAVLSEHDIASRILSDGPAEGSVALPTEASVALLTEGAAALRAADSIALRAYRRFEERGRQHGHDLEDWLEAEREFIRMPPK